MTSFWRYNKVITTLCSLVLPAAFLISGVGVASIWLPDMITHWDRVTHICVSNLTICGSYIGLSPGRHQTIILLLGTNVSEILIIILNKNAFKNVCKMAVILSLPQCDELWQPSQLMHFYTILLTCYHCDSTCIKMYFGEHKKLSLSLTTCVIYNF